MDKIVIRLQCSEETKKEVIEFLDKKNVFHEEFNSAFDAFKIERAEEELEALELHYKFPNGRFNTHENVSKLAAEFDDFNSFVNTDFIDEAVNNIIIDPLSQIDKDHINKILDERFKSFVKTKTSEWEHK